MRSTAGGTIVLMSLIGLAAWAWSKKATAKPTFSWPTGTSLRVLRLEEDGAIADVISGDEISDGSLLDLCPGFGLELQVPHGTVVSFAPHLESSIYQVSSDTSSGIHRILVRGWKKIQAAFGDTDLHIETTVTMAIPDGAEASFILVFDRKSCMAR